MSRSSWKLPYIAPTLFKNRYLNTILSNIRIRNSIIPSIFIKKKIKFCIFNGTWYLSMIMMPNMLGHKFGEFIFTKKSDTQTHLKRKVQRKTKK